MIISQSLVQMGSPPRLKSKSR